MSKGKTWRDVPIAGNVLEPGTSAAYKTGSWRSQRPVWSEEKCTQCYQCWMICPDVSIKLDESGKMCGIDYDYCKGCGLCAVICPPKAHAIEMVPEEEEK